ncbi:Sua5/YciO/YrdC/YwlC family protein [Cylindrobasidium torrendii FP15055 ss-10]|uniref:Threonylcarbamoyl-AMP synthase n=1 Tax=Cylindrobasidium torrendii FP15055 ss-10 TaxID=1314674 RepID=A0A0D7BU22_9AGAR|nr:Sua5/YciO/YrdC/YwlC family protein [Cylindrobasidium torrendii FP15055 ss-10]
MALRWRFKVQRTSRTLFVVQGYCQKDHSKAGNVEGGLWVELLVEWRLFETASSDVVGRICVVIVVYRSVLRELRKSSPKKGVMVSSLAANFRAVVEQAQGAEEGRVVQRVEAAASFLEAQRKYKELLDRYNPLIDLTGEERMEATARRVDADTAPTVTSPETLHALQSAASLLRAQQPVAFPTETVYGLGALALDAHAASRIFSTKGRPADNPLIAHVSSQGMLRTMLPASYKYPPTYDILMKHFWPGPLTLLFPTSDVVPSIITAHQPTVAIRMPSHPVARALIAFTGSPLAAPSANSSGRPSPTRAEHVYHDLNGKIDIILDGGPCQVGLESTVVDGLQPDGNLRILRPGGVTVEDIVRVLDEELSDGNARPKVLVHRRDYTDDKIEQAPTTPGMKYRHYSPSAPVTLLLTSSKPPQGEPLDGMTYIRSLSTHYHDATLTTSRCKIGIISLSDSPLGLATLPNDGTQWQRFLLGPKQEPAEAARRLFDGLLTLDQAGMDVILIEEVAEVEEGLAVMNRVRKAASELQYVSF